MRTVQPLLLRVDQSMSKRQNDVSHSQRGRFAVLEAAKAEPDYRLFDVRCSEAFVEHPAKTAASHLALLRFIDGVSVELLDISLEAVQVEQLTCAA